VKGSSIQEYLFQQIRERLPEDDSLADKIAEVLFISPDSAYRRIRGETPLVLEEARKLSESFGISLDRMLNTEENTVSFQPVMVQRDGYRFCDFLSDIEINLKRIEAFPGSEISYMTKDITLFQNFYFRPLFAFKHFFWKKSILKDPAYSKKQFCMDDLSEELEQKGKEILSVYNKIPSMEIWSSESVNSTISQIDHYREAGFIQPRELKLIYSALADTIEHIKYQAEEGCKFMPGEKPGLKKTNFQLYHNRLLLGANTILVNLGKRKMLYLNHELLNYMVTHDQDFCESINNSILDLKKQSTMLSEASEKQRNKFFNVILRKIPL
jgi:plasmid maintenance system antidote protein VapI